jgi:tRNA pseudouridine38-40 synthase
MPVIKLTLAYHGGPFAGWAVQPGERTVEGELEAALERIVGRPVSLAVAGRTDAGVHALGQVASTEITDPPEGLGRRLNALLPHEVAVLAADVVDDGFDARRDARSRTYRYRVLAAPMASPFEVGRALHWPHPLSRDALAACAAALLGTHDFTAFTPTETEHVRFERDVFAAEWRAQPLEPPQPGELLSFEIEADTFMRHMVRVLVGTMLEVGGGRRPLADFTALLEGAPRSAAGPTAPAHGLYLVAVRY